MRVGFYGDDFTGSVDALLQLRRAGLSGVLATSVEAADQLAADHPVVGIAGVARSLPTAAMADEVLPPLTWLLGRGAPVVQYKACSTADSSPQVGSLGRVVELVRPLVGEAAVPALFAQPDFGRYTFFGHHFARDGDRVYRLDRQPTMANHPVTPSRESDLVRHLAAQTHLPVGGIDWTRYRDAGILAAELTAATEAIVVCDGFTQQHLDLVGGAVAQLAAPDGRAGAVRPPVVALGAGGLSLGLGRALGGSAGPLPTTAAAAAGPCLVLAGSRSARTWEQVRAAARAGWRAVDLSEPGAVAAAYDALRSGADTVVYSSSPGGAELAVADVVAALVEVGRACLTGRTRLVVAGGDTSGAVLRGLGVVALAVQSAPWGNVVLCRLRAPGTAYDGADVVLKGGQMGHVDLFEDVRLGRPTTAVLPDAAVPQHVAGAPDLAGPAGPTEPEPAC